MTVRVYILTKQVIPCAAADSRMVKVTTNYLIRRIIFRKQLQVRKKDESDRQFLNRITHLSLQSQYIDQIAEINDCQSVLVVYLQCNMLKTIHNMNNFPNLIHLYLQRNLITKIENLAVLTRLKKIYLGYNEITVLEGLENLPNVTEVHIESQTFSIGETLYFEPRTVRNLTTTLRVLDVSNNNLTTLGGLNGLECLQVFTARDNQLTDLVNLTNTLVTWPALNQLNLTGNPITEKRRYRDSIIVSCQRLEMLDNKVIRENTREFVLRFTALKQRRYGAKPSEEKQPEDDLVEEKKLMKKLGFIAPGDYLPRMPGPGAASSGSSNAWKLRRNMNPAYPKIHKSYGKKKGSSAKKAGMAQGDIADLSDIAL